MSRININTAVISKREMKLSEAIRIFSELIKFRITVLVSFTTGLGYILGSKEITVSLFAVIAGIFLLACASSALNHWQEKDSDALMDRTRFRPIPSGRIQPATALIISISLLISGSIVLGVFTNLTALLVGLTAFVWYNALYTPLKRRSAFAIIPGAVVGALPPVAGWAAAGGNIFDYRLFIIAAYMFIWQIPHFWLLLLLYGDDYAKGGFPTLNRIFSAGQLKGITFIWMLAAVLLALMMPLFLYIYSSFTIPLLIAFSAVMAFVSIRFLFGSFERKNIRNSFIAINFYTLFLISVLSLDKLIKVF